MTARLFNTFRLLWKLMLLLIIVSMCNRSHTEESNSFILKVYNHMRCTKDETCAFLHRFHSLYISCDIDSKIYK